jgi:uncharacterized membrane protein YfcA
MTLAELAPYLVLIVIVAALYSSVGHGGASGYIAVLSLTALTKEVVSSVALTMNLLVAGIAFFAYMNQGYFRWRIVWPFLITSIPAAYVGAGVQVSEEIYYLVLAAVLVFAAVRLAIPNPKEKEEKKDAPILPALVLGLFIGLLSGVVGVGGGIFLSPIVILLGWGGAKETAAASALFIFVNSCAGIAGRAVEGTYHTDHILVLLGAGLVGAVVGSLLGARKFGAVVVQRTLAAVLIVAAYKLFVTHGPFAS